MPNSHLEQLALEARHAIKDYFKQTGEYKRVFIDRKLRVTLETYDGALIRFTSFSAQEREIEEENEPSETTSAQISQD